MGVADPLFSRLKLLIAKAIEAPGQPMKEKGRGLGGARQPGSPNPALVPNTARALMARPTVSVSVLMVSKFPRCKGTSHVGSGPP